MAAVGVLGCLLVLRAINRGGDEERCASIQTAQPERLEACAAVCKVEPNAAACVTHALLLAEASDPGESAHGLEELVAGCERKLAGACAPAVARLAFPRVGRPDRVKAVGLAKAACESETAACTIAAVGRELGWDGASGDASALYGRACAAGEGVACAYEALRSARERPGEAGVVGPLKTRALAALENACAGSDGEACAARGALVELDKPGDAVEIHRKACELGSSLGCNNLGVAVAEGRTERPSPERAVTLFEQACERGEAAGCNNLGAMRSAQPMVHRIGPRGAILYKLRCVDAFRIGCAAWGPKIIPWPGENSNLSAAASDWERACREGELVACVNHGALLHGGIGVKRDRLLAEAEFKRACDGGDGGGCGEMATAVRLATPDHAPDLETGAALMERACRGGELDACATWYALLANGQGVPRADPVAAVAALEKLCAAQEDENSCAYLSNLYASGLGAPKDRRKARELLVKRCESGADCQEFAALDGTPLKPETVTLLGRACQHDGAACFALGRELGRTGHFKESLDRARQACKWADPNGCADLALLHADARAGAKDLEKAKTISRDACWEGAVLACYVYGGLRKREPGGAAEAAKLFAFACDQGMSEGCANGAASTRKVKHVEVQRLRRVQAEDVKSESTTGDPTVLEDWQKAK